MADNIFTGATDSQWSVSTNWSLLAVPTASDGNVARFNALSPNCSLGSSNKVCNGIDFTGYTNTLAFGVRTLSVSGNAVLDPGMTWTTTTGSFVMNATGSLTTNGFTINTVLGFSGTSQTYTLQDNVIASGTLSLNGVTVAMTINNNGTAKTITVGGGISASAVGSTGTAKIIMNGTGVLTTTGVIQNDMDINTAGTITLGSAFRYSTGTFTYVAGTINTTTNNSTFTIGLVSVTTTVINSAGVPWNNVTSASNNTTTLTSDLEVNGTFTNTGVFVLNGSTLVINGNFTAAGANIMSGTTVVKFAGSSSTWSTGSGTLRNNVSIDTPGTLTISGTNIYNTGTITYVAGTVDATASTFTVGLDTTFDTDGMTFGTVLIQRNVQTLNSTLNAVTMQVGTTSSPTFTGMAGFSVDNFICTTINRTISLKAGNTYTVTTSLLLNGIGPTSLQNIRLLSDTGSSDVFFNLTSGATCLVKHVNATDINSAGGRLITDIKGTLVRTTNWARYNGDMYAFF